MTEDAGRKTNTDNPGQQTGSTGLREGLWGSGVGGLTEGSGNDQPGLRASGQREGQARRGPKDPVHGTVVLSATHLEHKESMCPGRLPGAFVSHSKVGGPMDGFGARWGWRAGHVLPSNAICAVEIQKWTAGKGLEVQKPHTRRLGQRFPGW